MPRQSMLTGLLVLLLSGCATQGGVPRPFPQPARAPSPVVQPFEVPNPSASTAEGYAVVGTALSLRGAPYRPGGADPAGFDCSGFVQYVFAQHGVSVPRAVSELFRHGSPVQPDDLEPGDLLFFTTIAPGASHVAIAVGGDAFIHAPSSNGEVRVEQLSSSYWAARFVGARRVQF